MSHKKPLKEDKPFGVSKTAADIDGKPVIIAPVVIKPVVENDEPKTVKKQRKFIGVLPDIEFG
jgi:hypothetical protein